MAQQTKVHGDLKGLMNYDVRAYTTGSLNAVTSGATVQIQGPKLDFGTVTFTGATSPSGADLKTAIDTIQQLAVVYLYEYTEVGDNTDTLAVAVYPTGAWDFTNGGSLDAALTAALGYAVTTAATATFTN
jgi:hypothetical protein